ncbi:MAG: deoxyuridine 5'-triphosphate nucleotidohydrolase [Clostridium sp.]
MKKVARFEKVSYSQFKQDWLDTFPNTSLTDIQEIYEKIKLPKRATTGSAGYDFFTPIAIRLSPKETIKIPTGIRVYIQEGWVLQLFPRSSLGFKYRLQMNNTVGIIDSDYYSSDNEGHIFIKMTNDTVENKTVDIPVLQGIAQGIFLPFGICEDDDTTEIRNGGFGSTNQN